MKSSTHSGTPKVHLAAKNIPFLQKTSTTSYVKNYSFRHFLFMWVRSQSFREWPPRYMQNNSAHKMAAAGKRLMTSISTNLPERLIFSVQVFSAPVQMVGSFVKLFYLNFKIQIFIAIYGFNMKNSFKWSHTSLELAQFVLEITHLYLKSRGGT